MDVRHERVLQFGSVNALMNRDDSQEDRRMKRRMRVLHTGLAGLVLVGAISGVDEVANKIEVLPASLNDDRIRWATFYRIDADDFLSRYAPGGVHGVLRELGDQRRLPGMQPVGFYAIAEVRAREVSAVFGVENDLVVAGQGEEGASR